MGMGNMAAGMAAKMAKRLALLGEISRLQGLVDQANRAKSGLNRVNMQISNSLSLWVIVLSAFQASVMAPVVVADRFEGESAEKISTRLPEPIAQMESTKAAAQGVQGEIAGQLAKLEIYIAEKGAEIDELRARLAAL